MDGIADALWARPCLFPNVSGAWTARAALIFSSSSDVCRNGKQMVARPRGALAVEAVRKCIDAFVSGDTDSDDKLTKADPVEARGKADITDPRPDFRF